MSGQIRPKQENFPDPKAEEITGCIYRLVLLSRCKRSGNFLGALMPIGCCPLVI